MLALVVLTAGLAGCASQDGGTEGTDGTDGADAEPVEATAEAPRWRLGDAWTYEIKTQGFPVTETTMLVYNETANLYRIGSTDEKQALIHALFNVNPQIGRIQKGNLAVFEDDKPRPMYDFPLTDGKSWQSDFFVSQHGTTLTATADYDPSIESPAGTFEGFHVNATGPQGFELRYDYVPQVKWFTKLVVREANGELLHELTLKQFRTNVSGTGYFVRGDDLFQSSYTGSNCGLTGCSDTVFVNGTDASDEQDRPYDLVAVNVQVNVSDPNNDRAQITIRDGAGEQVYSRELTSDQQSEFTFRVIREFATGDWSVDVSLTGGTKAKVRLAGGWSYSGTV